MLSFNQFLEEKCDCWKGYKRKPGTKPCAEGSCVKEKAKVGDPAPQHYRDQLAKDAAKYRKKQGVTEESELDEAANEEVEIEEGMQQTLRKYVPGYAKRQIDKKMDAGKFGKTDVDKDANFNRYKKIQDKLKEELSVDEQFDMIEEYVMELAETNKIDPESIWETLEEVSDQELLEYAVDAKGHKSSTGGLTQKGRDAYNAKGANLKAPVTTPPSKLKAGSKAANRRKSFCARMGGMEGPMKKPNGEPTRKALALRKWNC